MSNLLESHLVDQYLSELRKELTIRGLKDVRIQDVVSETRSHLTEMFESAKPKTAEDCAVLISGFGSAEDLAKKIAKEYARSAASRKFWWPALTTLFLLLLIIGIRGPNLPTWRIALIGTLIVSLIILGYAARKPSIGQFLALFGVLAVYWTLQTTATELPVWVHFPSNTIPPRLSFVVRSDLARYKADLQEELTKNELLLKEIRAGRDFFYSESKPALAPKFLLYNGAFMTPAGLENFIIGHSDSKESNPYGLESFAAAKQNWRIWQETHALSDLASQEVDSSRKTLESIQQTQTKPFSFLLKVDFLLALVPAAAISCIALLITNTGWLLWLIVHFVLRTARRWTYASSLATEGL